MRGMVLGSAFGFVARRAPLERLGCSRFRCGLSVWDENYMPAEVAEKLKDTGVWKGGKAD